MAHKLPGKAKKLTSHKFKSEKSCIDADTNRNLENIKETNLLKKNAACASIVHMNYESAITTVRS